ncbi:MAG: hypothetical protein H6713_31605 [Myxococcales bacterium]|nr:hypothetical protein [Myxococcales bacterium]
MSREPEHHHPDTRFELPPELAELVAAARAQPLPPIKTTPEQIYDGWRARRRADRASWLAGGLALAAGLALVLLSPDAPLSSSQSEPAAPEVSARVAAAPTPERVAPATVTPATVEAPELPCRRSSPRASSCRRLSPASLTSCACWRRCGSSSPSTPGRAASRSRPATAAS